MSLFGQLHTQRHRRLERLLTGHDMIRRQDQHHRMRIAQQKLGSHQRNGGGRIATDRLDHVVIFQRGFPLSQLHPNRIRLARIGRDDDLLGLRAGEDASHRLLNERLVADDP